MLRTFLKESIIAMNEGKFDLRGREFPGQDCEVTETLPGTAVLGMIWDKYEDTLSVSETCCSGVSGFAEQPISKRVMLSYAQRIFDSIGFTVPSTLLPKLLFQKHGQKFISGCSSRFGNSKFVLSLVFSVALFAKI